MTVVAKIAPSAMNAPASTERTKTSNAAIAAFVAPTFSALRATSAGGSASSPVGVNGASITPVRLALGPDGTVAQMQGIDVAATASRLAGSGGGYEVVHESPGLEIGVYVLVAPEPDRQTPHGYDEVYVVLDGEGDIEIEG